MAGIPVVRYIFVGGTTYLIEVGILLIASTLLHLPSTVSVTIAFWIGLVVSFILQKVIAFKDTSSTVKRLAWQSTAYALLIIINYLFTIFTVWALEPFTGLVISRTIALVITTLWNYIVYSKIIFKQTPPKQ